MLEEPSPVEHATRRYAHRLHQLDDRVAVASFEPRRGARPELFGATRVTQQLTQSVTKLGEPHDFAQVVPTLLVERVHSHPAVSGRHDTGQ